MVISACGFHTGRGGLSSTKPGASAAFDASTSHPAKRAPPQPPQSASGVSLWLAAEKGEDPSATLCLSEFTTKPPQITGPVVLPDDPNEQVRLQFVTRGWVVVGTSRKSLDVQTEVLLKALSEARNGRPDMLCELTMQLSKAVNSAEKKNESLRKMARSLHSQDSISEGALALEEVPLGLSLSLMLTLFCLIGLFPSGLGCRNSTRNFGVGR
jgi:hypothetical protein